MRANITFLAFVVLLATSCTTGGPLDTALERVEMTARLDTGKWGVRGVVKVQNRSAETTTFGVAALHCAVVLLLYQDSTEVWSQARVPRIGGCKWMPQDVTLRPGGSIEVSSEDQTPNMILGDSLPDGHYAARVRVTFARLVPHPDLQGALTTKVDSVAVLPAGAVELRR